MPVHRGEIYPDVRIPSEEGGLVMEYVFPCFQIRSLDPSRFQSTPAGKIATRAVGRGTVVVRCFHGVVPKPQCG